VKITIGLILLHVAFALFLLAGLGIDVGGLSLVALGLAAFAAAFISDRMVTSN
jgi:hypothetical protein